MGVEVGAAIINCLIFVWTITQRTLSSHFENMIEHDHVIFELIPGGFMTTWEAALENR